MGRAGAGLPGRFVEWTDGDNGTAPLLGCETKRRRPRLFGRPESNARASAETASHARGTPRQARGETREAARLTEKIPNRRVEIRLA